MPELHAIYMELEMELLTANLSVLMLQLQHLGLEMDIVMMVHGVCIWSAQPLIVMQEIAGLL
jgi:hypothetical protein